MGFPTHLALWICICFPPFDAYVGGLHEAITSMMEEEGGGLLPHGGIYARGVGLPGVQGGGEVISLDTLGEIVGPVPGGLVPIDRFWGLDRRPMHIPPFSLVQLHCIMPSLLSRAYLPHHSLQFLSEIGPQAGVW